ncbi:uncharacterized protein V1518DRAFT_409216 [Limtongia smithiae]|uniref:uncharacterized protein n=1 Tax=Limtongia smithiae TaxID=1125753 RepID=UPI0034CFE1AC
MPRNSSRRSAPPPRAPVQTRQASTYTAPAPVRASAPHSTAPPAHSAAPPMVAQPQQPGLFAQMATTAAGVAVGSAAGHAITGAIGGLFGGSSSSAPVEQQAVAPAATQSSFAPEEQGRSCEVDARNFTKCLDENNGNMQICGWYLQQLKACQELSRNL